MDLRANPNVYYLTTGDCMPVGDPKNVRPNPHLQFPPGTRVDYRYELQQIAEALDKSREANAHSNFPELPKLMKMA